MVHVHKPDVESAVQVAPVSVHVPVVGSVSDVELAVATDNCTLAVIPALPVKVSVWLRVMLSVDDEPLSEAVARSGVVGAGST